MPENSPVGDSESNGLAETGVQEVAGQIRVIKLGLEAALQCQIPIDHPIIPWLIEWAPDTQNYFSVGRDGKTSYERHKGKTFKVPMAEFGESVHFKVQSKKAGKEERCSRGGVLGFS